MAIKDMLVLLDNGAAQDAAAVSPAQLGPAPTLALELAGRLGAHVNGVALAVDPIVPGFVVAPLPVEVIEQARARSSRDLHGRLYHEVGHDPEVSSRSVIAQSRNTCALRLIGAGAVVEVNRK